MKTKNDTYDLSAQKTGEFIVLLRKEAGLTQTQLAEKLHVTNKAVSRWETGKGFPDIATVADLADLFGVSVDELLYGKRAEDEEDVKDANEAIAGAFLQKAKKEKHFGKRIAILCVAVTVFAVVFCLLFAALYSSVMGNKDCMIAKDYSYITIHGEKYLPFDVKDCTCKTGARLVNEASVEDADFFTKLFFSDSIYTVEGCDGDEFIYLQSDYDGPSEYYCLASCITKYEQLLEKGGDKCVAVITNKNWQEYDVVVDDRLAALVQAPGSLSKSASVNCSTSRARDDEEIPIVRKQSAGPFRRSIGAFIRKDGEYYWFDYADIPAEQNNADYRGILAYELPDDVDAILDKLFDRMIE